MSHLLKLITKQRIIATLTLVIALCGLLMAAAVPLELSERAVAFIGIILGLSSTLLKLASNQAIDEALYTPPPPRRGPLVASEDMAAPREQHHPAPPVAVPDPPQPGDTWPAWRKDQSDG